MPITSKHSKFQSSPGMNKLLNNRLYSLNSPILSNKTSAILSITKSFLKKLKQQLSVWQTKIRIACILKVIYHYIRVHIRLHVYSALIKTPANISKHLSFICLLRPPVCKPHPKYWPSNLIECIIEYKCLYKKSQWLIFISLPFNQFILKTHQHSYQRNRTLFSVALPV